MPGFWRRPKVTMGTPKVLIYECGSCGWEVAGYSKKDLTETGWEFFDAGDRRTFVMCDECVVKYAERRGRAVM